jgi:hypothetical protein
MIFYCYDIKTRALIFKHSGIDDHHDCISSRNLNFKVDEACICGKDRYFIVKQNEKSGRIFAICFDNIRVRKEAVFYAKHTIQMFLLSNPIIDTRHNIYEEIVKTSIHNTKNLNAQITSKILSYLKEETLSEAPDKVKYIEKLLEKDIKGFAREVLSILRMSTQISNEYNVIDYLKPNIQLKKSEFGYKRIHSLLVIAFYQFESDFKNKNIFIRINQTNLSAFVNYNTVQTMLTHIYTNALRYCLPNTDVNINTRVVSDEYVEIKFTMRSLYLTDEIIKEGCLNGIRCEQAKRIHEKGTGVGLGIVHALSVLNKGCFVYNRISDTKYEIDNYIYSDNYFVVTLLKEEFY